jgi:hypothetical protein
MTNDEIAGSLLVLETFAVSAFALSIAHAAREDHPKVSRLLEQTREAISARAITLGADAQETAAKYADHQLAVLTQLLRDLGVGDVQQH